MMPYTQGLPLLILGSCFAYIVAMPAERERVRDRVDQDIK